jgi:hypothetical protein
LERFRDELRALDRDRTGEATLTHQEEQFGATVRLGAAEARMTGFVREHLGAELRYDVGADPSSIPQALAEFDALVRAFPVRE